MSKKPCKKKAPPTDELSRRFVNGLAELGLTQEDLKEWKYCGGTFGSHKNYWKLCCPGESCPPKEGRCVCKHVINENCYITNGDEILILGNCCIKKFVPKAGRTCQNCGAGHKNHKDNLCRECR